MVSNICLFFMVLSVVYLFSFCVNIIIKILASKEDIKPIKLFWWEKLLLILSISYQITYEIIRLS